MKKPLLTLASAILFTLPGLNWAQQAAPAAPAAPAVAPAAAPASATPANTSATPKAEKKSKKSKKKKSSTTSDYYSDVHKQPNPTRQKKKQLLSPRRKRRATNILFLNLI